MHYPKGTTARSKGGVNLVNVNGLSASIEQAVLGILTTSYPPKRIDYPGFSIYFVGDNLLRVDINIRESERNYA